MWGKKKKIDLGTLEDLKKRAEGAVRGGKELKAIKVYRTIIQYGRELGREKAGDYIARAHFGLGTSALGDKDYRNAKGHYQSALKLYEISGNRKHIRNTRSRLAEIAEKEGNVGTSVLRKIGFATAITCFLGVLFFMFNGFTGYSIIDINQKSSNFFGVGLFFIGIIGLYFWMRKN